MTDRRATVVWSGAGGSIACHGPAGQRREAPGPLEGGLHVARLRRLVPDGAYVCRVAGTGRQRLRFRTAPRGNEPFTFAVVGDSGDGSPRAARLARRIRAARPAFLLHLGDLAYEDATIDEIDRRFFRPYRRVLGTAPLFATPGNHDLRSDSAYRRVFAPITAGRPGGSAIYSFDWGAAHLTGIRSNDFVRQASRYPGRLARHLAAARDRPWRVVFLHHPPYSPGLKPVPHGLRAAIEPVFERGGVDLVLAGHEHLYARTAPACEFVAGSRVVEIISGGGGTHLNARRDHPNFPRIASRTHFVRIRVTEDALDIRAVNARGRVIDRIRLRRGGGVPCRADGWPRPIEP